MSALQFLASPAVNIQELQIVSLADHFSSEAFEVFGVDLTVYQFPVASLNKLNEGRFGCIGCPAEHTFPTKYATANYSIQASYKLAVLPGLNG